MKFTARYLKRVLKKIKNPFKKLRIFLKSQLGWLDELQILPYIGFGNEKKIFVKGHVLEAKALAKPKNNHSMWQNALAMLKRYSSDEIPGVKVKAIIGGYEVITETNFDGSFNFEIDVNFKIPENENWHKIRFELLDDISKEKRKVTAEGECMILNKASSFGIISDIDDTFLVSHSTQLSKKLRLMLFKNASTRMPFEGVSAFYQALHKINHRDVFNPIFYVSSSEWNLYDLLVDFCTFHGIPKGPFLLKSIKKGLGELVQSGGETHQHKLEKISHILEVYHDLNFILIGDSGQRDAEIYQQITEVFPSQINAIYIRDVKKNRHKQVKKIAQEVSSRGIDMLLVKDTQEAAEHAIAQGYIKKEELIEIIHQKEKDKTKDMPFV